MCKYHILITLTLLTICCFPSGVYSVIGLQCYTCESVDACKSPKKQNCNPSLANETSAYLDVHYDTLNKTVTEFTYDCISDRLSDENIEVQYKGCVYAYIESCTLIPSSIHTVYHYTRSCHQCDTDFCNPASRVDINAMLFSAVIALGSTLKRITTV